MGHYNNARQSMAADRTGRKILGQLLGDSFLVVLLAP